MEMLFQCYAQHKGLTQTEEYLLVKKLKIALELMKIEKPSEKQKKHIRIGIASRNKLVCANIGLVFKVAKQMKYFVKTTLEERVSSGLVGLIYATNKFDPGRNIKFATYATYWIKQRIQMHALDNDVIHVPKYVIQAPDTHKFKVYGESTKNIHDVDSIEVEKSYDKELYREDELLKLRAALKLLTKRERRVITERWYEEKTLSEVAHDLKLTKERVRQIQIIATEKLKELLDAKVDISESEQYRQIQGKFR